MSKFEEYLESAIKSAKSFFDRLEKTKDYNAAIDLAALIAEMNDDNKKTAMKIIDINFRDKSFKEIQKDVDARLKERASINRWAKNSSKSFPHNSPWS